MKTTDLLVKALENEGVTTIYGVPGEENLDLLDSLSRSSIELVLTRHEQSAAFIAATEGRFTGCPGVCLSTLGPGATNLLTGVAQAMLAGMPLICLTGQKPIGPRDQGRFQILDVVAMMRPVTKMAQAIVDPDDVPTLVRDAFRTATRAKPGPVHLELAMDVAQAQTEAQVLPVSNAVPAAAGEAALDEAAARIRAAERPLVLLASGTNREEAHDACSALIERSGLPFFTTQMGKGVVDDAHPRCLGTATLSSGDLVHRAVEHADLIVNVGHDLCEKPPFVMDGGGAEVIHVAHEAAAIDPVYFPQHELVGCLEANVAALAERLEGVGDEAVFADVRADYEAKILGRSVAGLGPAHPLRIVRDVRAALPEAGIVSLDNGMYKLWFSRYYRAAKPHTLLLDNALATMGAGLPVAIGAKRARPEQPVVAVAGDGGLSMNSAELETAVRLDLDLVVVVLRDDALGMIRWKQRVDGFEDFGLTFANPRFDRLAEAYGATGHSVGDAGLRPVLEQALSAGGVHLIDCPIDYTPNEEEFG